MSPRIQGGRPGPRDRAVVAVANLVLSLATKTYRQALKDVIVQPEPQERDE